MSADIGERAVISVVLLFDPQDAQDLVDASRQIRGTTKSAVVLGDSAIPHVTLVQFFASAAEAGALWNDVEGLQGSVTEATSTGLLFLPETTRNNMWVEMSFFQSHALTNLRDAVLATPFAQRFEANNGAPDLFRPHVTLAMYAGKRVSSLRLDEFSIFRKTYRHLRLGIGVNGPNLSLIKLVH